MKSKLVLNLVLAVAIQTGAMAQTSQNYYNQIYKYASEESQVRGGGKTGKALGLYAGGFSVAYKSGYTKVDPKVQAEFACALNNFILNSGGGYNVYQNSPPSPERIVTYTPLDKKLEQLDPSERAFVPYKKQEQFAKSWWESHSTGFSKMGFVWKDWWVNDSILDANLLISRVTMETNGSTAATYNSAVFAKLMKKE